jgi:hypothetical protein
MASSTVKVSTVSAGGSVQGTIPSSNKGTGNDD